MLFLYWITQVEVFLGSLGWPPPRGVVYESDTPKVFQMTENSRKKKDRNSGKTWFGNVGHNPFRLLVYI